MTLAATGPDLWLLVAAAFVAGLVRGFSGFGTAMIYLPVAGQFLSPFAAITTLVVFDLIAPLPTVPRALREGHRADVLRLTGGLIIGLPIGLYLLSLASPVFFRYAVSGIALLLLVCLISGLRYRGTLTRPMIFGTGGLGGVLMGIAGLPGPPVILLYMASPLPVQVIRANTLLYLILTDVVYLPVLALIGRLEVGAVLLGCVLVAPSLLGNVIGAWLFRPGQERVYRGIAYAIIAASALSGLPVWD
ncbi:MAG: sulfite exporter TauE/SafE family protein [Pseudomonadota bacterium]